MTSYCELLVASLLPTSFLVDLARDVAAEEPRLPASELWIQAGMEIAMGLSQQRLRASARRQMRPAQRG